MKLKYFEVGTVDRQGNWIEKLNEELVHAVSVETYIRDDKTLIIFAFYDGR